MQISFFWGGFDYKKNRCRELYNEIVFAALSRIKMKSIPYISYHMPAYFDSYKYLNFIFVKYILLILG